jgi:hypothetical protein
MAIPRFPEICANEIEANKKTKTADLWKPLEPLQKDGIKIIKRIARNNKKAFSREENKPNNPGESINNGLKRNVNTLKPWL